MNTAQDVLSALANPAIVFTDDDVRRGLDLLKARHGHNAGHAARAFKVGDQVEFDEGGKTWKGKVIKVNQKTVDVQCNNGRWQVQRALLRWTI